MAANITAYLRQGEKYINLNDTEYHLGGDFTPPGENQEFGVSAGTSANEVGGGEAVSRIRQDRIWRFRVQVLGTSALQIEANTQRLVSMLAEWGDPSDPLYLEYKGHTLPEPLWGQFGALKRYQVVHAEVTRVGNYYAVGNTRTQYVEVEVELRVKPDALGRKQRLATASGGIQEDIYGKPDGTSRGLMVHRATTNKLPRPVFSNGVGSWTAGANLVATLSTDTRYLLPGTTASMKLTQTAAGLNNFTYSINVGNTNKHSFSAYILKPDYSTPTSADVQIYYDSAQATSFRHLGGGLWLAYTDNIDGSNSSKAAGVIVGLNRTVYLLGFQVEERAYHTPLVFGDMLGCSWSGTAHASTSVRAAGMVMLATGLDTMAPSAGTTCIALKAQVAATAPVSYQVWDTRTASEGGYMHLLYDATVDKFVLTDGTNTVSSAVQTFAAGDVVRVYASWGAAGLKLYVNGGTPVTGTYTIPAITPPIGPNVYIGCSFIAGGEAMATVMGMTFYQLQKTDTEIAAIDAAASVSASNDQRIDYIPWFWTDDGDNVTDNADSGSYQNWGIISGVAGNVEANTYWKGVISGALPGDSIYMSRLEMPYAKFEKPSFLTYNGAPDVVSVDTTGAALAYVSLSTRYYKLLAGKYFAVMVVGNEDGSNNMHLQTAISPGAEYYTSDYENSSFRTTGTTEYSVDSAPFLNMLANASQFEVFEITRQVTVRVAGKRTSGGAADFRLSFAQIFPKPMLVLRATSMAINWDGFVLSGREAYALFGSSLYFPYEVIGDVVNVVPGHYNAILSLIGAESVLSGPGESILWTIYIEPRWSVL